MKYVLDSNIISYALKGNLEIRQKMDATAAMEHEMIMPHIVYFEVKRWLLEIGATSKQRVFVRWPTLSRQVLSLIKDGNPPLK